MKLWLYIAAVLGLGLAAALVFYNNAGLVLSTILSQGPGLILVVLFHAVPLVLSAGSWWLVTRPDWPAARFTDFFAARVLREAVNDLLPVAQVGGPLAGARLLTLQGVPGLPVAANLIVDVTAETISQAVFTLTGIGLLALDGRAPWAVQVAIPGAVLLVLALIAFVLAQRAGLVKLIDRFARGMFEKIGAAGLDASENLHEAVWRSYGRLRILALSFLIHVLCWMIGAGEVWLALHFLGHPVSLGEAMILESLGQAIRSAAFVVPSGLGVQEGGFVLLGAAFGLSSPVSLALSLTKRVREVTWGGLSLLAWQLIEGRRFAQSLRAPGRAAGE